MATKNMMLRTLTASSSRTLLGPRSAAVLARRHRRHYNAVAASSSEEIQEEAKHEVRFLSVISLLSVTLRRLRKAGYGSTLSFQSVWADWSKSWTLSSLARCVAHISVAFSVRRYIGYVREDTLLERLRTLLSKVNTHGFELLSLEPHVKDGGVFVKFRYTASDTESALDKIVEDLRNQVHSHGGVPSWYGIPTGEVWLVKGSPWREVRSLTLWVLVHTIHRSMLPLSNVGPASLCLSFATSSLRWTRPSGRVAISVAQGTSFLACPPVQVLTPPSAIRQNIRHYPSLPSACR